VARRGPKPKPGADWQITRITGKGALYIGRVQARDADAAIRLAISKYDIEAKYHDRVATRPIARAG
jgi:hypothetical protein